ncbi:hypothetical protein LPJ56_006448, partial [Coemansia sp. RSA 2599]
PLTAAASRRGHSSLSTDRALSQAVAALPYMMTTGAAASTASATPAPPSTGGFVANGATRMASRKTTGRIVSPFSAASLIGGSGRRSGASEALFASIDSYSEHSATPPMPLLPSDNRRYSATANFRDGGSRFQSAASRPSRVSNASADTRAMTSKVQERNESGAFYQGTQSGLAAFPSLDEGAAECEEPASPLRPKETRSARGSNVHDNSDGDTRKTDGFGAVDSGLSPTPTKSQVQQQQQQQTRNGYDAGLSIQLPGIGGGRQS